MSAVELPISFIILKPDYIDRVIKRFKQACVNIDRSYLEDLIEEYDLTDHESGLLREINSLGEPKAPLDYDLEELLLCNQSLIGAVYQRGKNMPPETPEFYDLVGNPVNLPNQIKEILDRVEPDPYYGSIIITPDSNGQIGCDLKRLNFCSMGTEFPSCRIFQTSEGKLVMVVEYDTESG